MRVFVMQHGDGPDVQAETAPGIRLSTGIRVPVGVVQTPNVARRSPLGHGVGVAENDGPARIRLLGVRVFAAEIRAPIAFVRQRPQDDAGMIAIPLDHFGELLHIGCGEGGIVLRRANGLVHERDCGLVFHVKAVFVAPLQQVFPRGIMGGANEIDVGVAKQSDVRFHLLRGHGAARRRMRVMAVDAAQFDCASVDEQFAPLHLKASDAEALVDRLQHSLRRFKPQFQGIQTGVFGIPQRRFRQGQGPRDARLASQSGIPCRIVQRHPRTRRIAQDGPQLHVLAGMGRHLDMHRDLRCAQIRGHAAIDMHAMEANRRYGHHAHVANDAADIEAAELGRDVRNAHGQPESLPGRHPVRDLAVPGSEPAVMPPRELPVDPYARLARNPVEAQEHALPREVRRHGHVRMESVFFALRELPTAGKRAAGHAPFPPRVLADPGHPEAVGRSRVKVPGTVQGNDRLRYAGRHGRHLDPGPRRAPSQVRRGGMRHACGHLRTTEGRLYRWAYGSAASRRPSPMKLKLNTTMTTNRPGKNSQG